MSRKRENREKSLIVKIRPGTLEKDIFPLGCLVMDPFWDDLIMNGKKKYRKKS